MFGYNDNYPCGWGEWWQKMQPEDGLVLTGLFSHLAILGGKNVRHRALLPDSCNWDGLFPKPVPADFPPSVIGQDCLNVFAKTHSSSLNRPLARNPAIVEMPSHWERPHPMARLCPA